MKATFEGVRNRREVANESRTEGSEFDADLGSGFRRPLRILFAVNAPWTERLGVPRVSMELTRQLERLGHQCSRYTWQEAFPRGLGKWSRFFELCLFQWRLLDFLRRQGRNFDVVQLECNLAPFPRAAYGFIGIMVAKSNRPQTHHFQTEPRGARRTSRGRFVMITAFAEGSYQAV